MAGLRPGALLPKDMNPVQYASWCKQQQTTDPGDVAAQIAIHTASSDNTTEAKLVAAIAAHAASTDNTTAAELAAALLPYLQTSGLLAAILAIDGAGSGIDADLLDAQSSAYYLARGNHTGTQPVSTLSDLPTLASGTYTPTVTGVTNTDAVTAFTCQYMRVGSVVTVSGIVGVDPTAAADTQVGISLPIASAFSAIEDCAGTAYSLSIQEGAAIWADVTNDRAELRMLASDTLNRNFYFSFTYRVI